MLSTRILSGMLVLALLTQVATPVRGEAGGQAGTHFDLSSSTASLAAPDPQGSVVYITQDGAQVPVNPAAMLTPAQYVAVSQVLSGAQTIQLNASGAAIGGTFSLPAGVTNLASLVVPQGVTAVHDFAGANLSLSGNFVNSGSFYAVSSAATATTASILALNITNGPGALLTSVLPQGGLAGYSNLLSSLNLSLNAVNNITNYGTISSSGSLSMAAGGTIANLNPGGGLSPAVMSAINNVVMQASQIVNQGSILAQNGAVNIVTANLQNASIIESLMSSVTVSDIGLGANVLDVLNQDGTIRASQGTVSLLSDLDLSLSGGAVSASELQFRAANGLVSLDGADLQGPVHIKAESTHVYSPGSLLQLAEIDVSGDPSFVSGGNLDINTFVPVVPGTPVSFGQSVLFLAKGNITGTDVAISNTAGTFHMIAGADFNPGPGPSFTVLGASTTGGDIVVSSSGPGKTSINSAGSVVLAAFSQTNVGGAVKIAGDVTSVNGSILVAGPNEIRLGNVTTQNGGNITVAQVQPGITAPLTYQVDGTNSSGAITATFGTAPPSNFVVGNVTSSAAGNAGNVSLFANSFLDVKNIAAVGGPGCNGGLVTLESTSSSVSAGSINASGAGTAGSVTVKVGPGQSFTASAPITVAGGAGGPVFVESQLGQLNLPSALTIGAGTAQLTVKSPVKVAIGANIDAGGAAFFSHSPILHLNDASGVSNAGAVTVDVGGTGVPLQVVVADGGSGFLRTTGGDIQFNAPNDQDLIVRAVSNPPATPTTLDLKGGKVTFTVTDTAAPGAPSFKILNGAGAPNANVTVKSDNQITVDLHGPAAKIQSRGRLLSDRSLLPAIPFILIRSDSNLTFSPVESNFGLLEEAGLNPHLAVIETSTGAGVITWGLDMTGPNSAPSSVGLQFRTNNFVLSNALEPAVIKTTSGQNIIISGLGAGDLQVTGPVGNATLAAAGRISITGNVGGAVNFNGGGSTIKLQSSDTVIAATDGQIRVAPGVTLASEVYSAGTPATITLDLHGTARLQNQGLITNDSVAALAPTITVKSDGVLNLSSGNTELGSIQQLADGTTRFEAIAPGGQIVVADAISVGGGAGLSALEFHSPMVVFASGSVTSGSEIRVRPGIVGGINIEVDTATLTAPQITMDAPAPFSVNLSGIGGGIGALQTVGNTTIDKSIAGDINIGAGLSWDATGDVSLIALDPLFAINQLGTIRASGVLTMRTRDLHLGSGSLSQGANVQIDGGALLNVNMNIVGPANATATIASTTGGINVTPAPTFNINFQGGGSPTTINMNTPAGKDALIGTILGSGSIVVEDNVALVANHNVEFKAPNLVLGNGSQLSGGTVYIHGGAGNALLNIISSSGGSSTIQSTIGILDIGADNGQAIVFSKSGAAPTTLNLLGAQTPIVSSDVQDITIAGGVTLHMESAGTPPGGFLFANNATVHNFGQITNTNGGIHIQGRTLDLGSGSTINVHNLSVDTTGGQLNINTPSGATATVITTGGNADFTGSGNALVFNNPAAGLGTLSVQTTGGQGFFSGKGISIGSNVVIDGNDRLNFTSTDGQLDANGKIQSVNAISLQGTSGGAGTPGNVNIGNALSSAQISISAAGGRNINQTAGTIDAGTSATLTVVGGGSITQGAGALLKTSGTLTLNAGTGSVGPLASSASTVVLNTSGPTTITNAVASTVSGNAASGSFTNTGALTVGPTSISGDFTFSSDTSITTAGGSGISGNNLTFVTPLLSNDGSIGAAVDLNVNYTGNLQVNGIGDLSGGNKVLFTSTNGFVNASQNSISGPVNGSANGSFSVLTHGDLTTSNVFSFTGNLSLTSTNNSLTVTNNAVASLGSVSLNAVNGLLLVDQGATVRGGAHVDMQGGQVGIGQAFGLATSVNAGTLSAAAAVLGLDTNILSYDFASIPVPGRIKITAGGGGLIIEDNVTMVSRGQSITLISSGGIAIGNNNTLFAEGGNVTINASSGDVNIFAGTVITAVARALFPAVPFTTIPENMTISDFFGGDVGINVDQAVANYDNDLHTFDQNRLVAGIGGPFAGLGTDIFFNGTTAVPAPTKGGSVLLDAGPIGQINITDSSLLADGAVIHIDPPASNVTLNQVVVRAFGPDLVNGFNNTNNSNTQTQQAPVNNAPVTVVNNSPVVIPPDPEPGTGPGGGAPTGTVLPTDSINENATLPTPSANNAPAPLATDVIVLEEKQEKQNTSEVNPNTTNNTQNFIPVTYVGTAPCQQFLIAGRRDNDLRCITVVASKGTVLGTVKDESPQSLASRVLSLKEGKIVVVSGQKSGLKLDVNQGSVNLPVSSIAVVTKKASGAVSVSMISGRGKAQIALKGEDGTEKLEEAAAGEEIAFGDSAEELIAADGIERQLISAKIVVTSQSVVDDPGSSSTGTATSSNLRTQKHNLRVERRHFNKEKVVENESLLACLDCAQIGCSTGKCERFKKNLKPGKSKNINISQAPEESPFAPIGYQISMGTPKAVQPSLSSINLSSGTIKTMGADISDGGSIVSLASGEVLVCPSKKMSLKAGHVTVVVDPDTLVLVNNRQSSVTVSNLWEGKSGAVQIHAGRRFYSPRPGEECVIVPSEKSRDAARISGAARRNVRTFSVGGTNSMAVSEVSLASLFLTSPVLYRLWHSPSSHDRSVAEKIAKMYAVLNIVTGRRGPYSLAGGR